MPNSNFYVKDHYNFSHRYFFFVFLKGLKAFAIKKIEASSSNAAQSSSSSNAAQNYLDKSCNFSQRSIR